MPLDIAPAHEGAERDAAIIDADAAKRRDWTMSTSNLGAAMRKASIGIRLCPPAADFGLVAMLGQKDDRFFDAARAHSQTAALHGQR
jgi:hypothetical protein